MNRLQRVTIAPPREGGDRYPFSVPAVQATAQLEFSTAVTFFVGENGSGKSTSLLEGLAAKLRLPTVGSMSTEEDSRPSFTRGNSARR